MSGPLLGFASRAVRPSRTFITSPSVGRPTSFLPLRAAGRVVRSVVKPACFFRCVEAPSFCADVPTSWSDDPRARVLCATPQGAHSLVCGFVDHLTVHTSKPLLLLLTVVAVVSVFPDLLDCLRLSFPRFAYRAQSHTHSLEGWIPRRVFRHLLRETP